MNPKVRNGFYTFTNVSSGEHRTFRIKTQPKDAKFAPGSRVVGLLTGPDNERNYESFAFLVDRANQPGKVTVVLYRRKQDSKHYRFFKLILESFLNGTPDDFFHVNYRMQLEARCCFCNRLLTTPESLDMGYGPECAEKHGLEHKQTGLCDDSAYFAEQKKQESLLQLG